MPGELERASFLAAKITAPYMNIMLLTCLLPCAQPCLKAKIREEKRLEKKDEDPDTFHSFQRRFSRPYELLVFLDI